MDDQLKNFGTSPDYGSGRRSLPWLVNAGVSAGLLAYDARRCSHIDSVIISFARHRLRNALDLVLRVALTEADFLGQLPLVMRIFCDIFSYIGPK